MIVDIQALLQQRLTATSSPTTRDIVKGFNWDVAETIGGLYTIAAGATITFLTLTMKPKFVFFYVEEDVNGDRLPLELYLTSGSYAVEASFLCVEYPDDTANGLIIVNGNATAVSFRLYGGGAIMVTEVPAPAP